MSVADEVRHERQRQRSRWGAQNDRNHSWYDWRGYMMERMVLVGPQHNKRDVPKRRRALIELAALAIAAIEANE